MEFMPTTVASGGFTLVMMLLSFGACFWARKYWGKRDPESLDAADEAAKKFGDRFK